MIPKPIRKRVTTVHGKLWHGAAHCNGNAFTTYCNVFGRQAKHKALNCSIELKMFYATRVGPKLRDRKSTRLNSSHIPLSRMPSSA
mgnify:CR=1 FL=1